MARDLTPIVKRSRRENLALHPKAHKVMIRRKGPPGGLTRRRGNASQYSLQLREKQKVKRLYGLLEKPFKRLVTEAEVMTGVSGENLLQLLERRLDNVVYRLYWAPSRQAARQLVTHGHVLLNGKRVDIPSIRVKIGDELKIRPKSSQNQYFKTLTEQLANAETTPSSWIGSRPSSFEAKITGQPSKDERDPGINEQLIIEFYSR